MATRNDEMFTLGAAAQRFCIKRSEIEAAIARGRIESVERNGEALVRADDVQTVVRESFGLEPDQLRLVDAAEIAGTTADGLRGAIHRGRLKGERGPRGWIVRRDDLYRYLEQKTTWKWNRP